MADVARSPVPAIGAGDLKRFRDAKEEAERRLVIDVAAKLYAAWITNTVEPLPTVESVVADARALIAEVDRG
jgi:hypothetical protein